MTTATRPTTLTMSAADVAAHEAASHVRLPRRVPAGGLSSAELRATTEIAYLERERQLLEQVAFELAAGGEW